MVGIRILEYWLEKYANCWHKPACSPDIVPNWQMEPRQSGRKQIAILLTTIFPHNWAKTNKKYETQTFINWLKSMATTIHRMQAIRKRRNYAKRNLTKKEKALNCKKKEEEKRNKLTKNKCWRCSSLIRICPSLHKMHIVLILPKQKGKQTNKRRRDKHE